MFDAISAKRHLIFFAEMGDCVGWVVVAFHFGTVTGGELVVVGDSDWVDSCLFLVDHGGKSGNSH